MLEPAPFFAEIAEGPAGAAAYWLRTDDDVQIRMGHYPAEARHGTVLLFPGRTEYIEKYGRTAQGFAAHGYHSVVIDWRGQGLADRLVEERLTGHVHIFEDYQRDIAAVIAAMEALDLPKPYHLIGHSMGGCIALRAVMDGLPVASVAFSGPMWGIAMSSGVRPAAWAVSQIGTAMGFGNAHVPGTKPISYILHESFEDNLLTRDPDMWDYMRRQSEAQPELQLGGPSLRWLSEALAECRKLARRPSPNLPCLTFAGSNERIVDKDKISQRMQSWSRGQLRWVQGAQHECLMDLPDVRDQLLADMVEHFELAIEERPTLEEVETGDAPRP